MMVRVGPQANCAIWSTNEYDVTFASYVVLAVVLLSVFPPSDSVPVVHVVRPSLGFCFILTHANTHNNIACSIFLDANTNYKTNMCCRISMYLVG